MIRELVRLVETELGLTLPGDIKRRIEAGLCRQFGGRRVYVPARLAREKAPRMPPGRA